MSEISRSRVTITLGRTGQVVKRAGSSLDISLGNDYPVVGSKRPVRERLGSDIDSYREVNNKRLRRDGRTPESIYDSQLRKDDLRYKIMQKNLQKQSQNGGDLRNILSRPAQSSTNSVATRERSERMPEPKDTRSRYLEPMDDRNHFTETRDGRSSLPVTRNTSMHIPEFRVDHTIDPRKQYIVQAREGERSIFEAKDVRRPIPEPRSSYAVPRIDSGINSYSPWTLESLRQRSPDESLVTSRGVTAPKKVEILQRRFEVREPDDARSSIYMSKDCFDISRPMGSSNLTKMKPPVGQTKTIAPVAAPLTLSGSLGQKRSYVVVDDQVTVDSFLRSLGLEKFSIVFKAEEVDMYSLKRMSERDLKELGIPMGPRKKILLELQPRLKQQA